MANWINNRIEIKATAEQMEEIMNFVRRDGDVYGSFDFNKLIPMPESLNVTAGAITTDAISAYASSLYADLTARENSSVQGQDNSREVQGTISLAMNMLRFGIVSRSWPPETIKEQAAYYGMSAEDFIALGKQYVDNQRQYGAHSWYPWCKKNWGTKWNTEGKVFTKDNQLEFFSANSAPLPVMKALSRQFPDVKITHMWADEDMGVYAGKQTYRNGQVYSRNIPEPYSKEAYEMSFAAWRISPEERFLRFDEKEGTYVYDESLEERYYEAERASLDNMIDKAQAKAELNRTEVKEQPDRNIPQR